MTKLPVLIALAREPSSERRRELLREVTDMFFVNPHDRPETELGLFDDVLTQLSSEMEDAASTLGAGALRTTLRVTLPLALPAIMGAFIVVFLEAIALFGKHATQCSLDVHLVLAREDVVGQHHD